jgi:hypothetical protein
MILECWSLVLQPLTLANSGLVKGKEDQATFDQGLESCADYDTNALAREAQIETRGGWKYL